MESEIKVLIVDDSAIVRELTSKYLSGHPRIRVVGTAPDAYIARRKIVSEEVDVIILDIEMPKMDGLTFLKYLMRSYPKPVIILSSLALNQEDLVFEALRTGAVDVVPKPGGPYSVREVIDTLTEKVLAASVSSLAGIKKIRKNQPVKAKKEKIFSKYKGSKKIITIGASTGGTIALEALFKEFSPYFPPTLVTIHMPENFTKTFASRLNGLSAATIKEAESHEILKVGHIYIAPGNYHLQLKTRGLDFIAKIIKGPKVNNHRPSVDVLFKSVAEHMGRNSCGILLTGMGKDGAAGLLDIHRNGGYTIAQDESTSIVFGMPYEAIKLGAATAVLPLRKIANHIIQNFIDKDDFLP